MDHRMLRKTVSVFLAVLLLMGCVQTAGAAGKVKDCSCFGLEQENFPLFYVPSTLPDNVSADEWKTYLSMYQTVVWGESEGFPDAYAETCEITLLSGSESIKDALTFERFQQEGSGEFYSVLKMDNEKLTEPGKAKVHVRLESEHFQLDRDLVICVASWEENPAYEFVGGEHLIRTTVGETLSNQYFMDTLAVQRLAAASAALAEGDEQWKLASSLSVVPGDDAAWDMMAEQGDYGVTGYKVKKAGSCFMDVTLSHGNIKYKDTVRVTALDYMLQGARALKPGDTAVYEVKDLASGSGRTFTLSAEGEGISFDAETGTLTVPDSVPSGTVITVTATPDSGEPVSVTVTVASGCFQDLAYETRVREGFLLPVPAGDDWDTEVYEEGSTSAFYSESKDGQFIWSAEFYLPSGVALVTSDEEAELQYSEEGMFNNEQKNIESAYVTIDGHKGRAWTFENYSGGQFYAHTALLRYARNNRLLSILFISLAGENGTPGNTPIITMDDMMRVAGEIGYDETQAPFIAADAQITVTEKNNATTVAAGKSLQFSAAFGNPERVNKKNGNDTILWRVLLANGGMCEDEAGITDKGQLITGKSMTEPVELLVEAVSQDYGTVGEYPVTVIPAVKTISVEPADLFLFVGTDEARTVQASTDPESVASIGLTWESKSKNVVEITDAGNGAVEIRPLKAGKTTVTAKEPGGKSAKVNVVVGEPVTALELSAKGKTAPGGTVSLTAKLTPAKPADKTVEWSIDVGEDVATINAKGQLKIAKETAEGTVITVTCKALGAPEPLTETIQITVGQ